MISSFPFQPLSTGDLQGWLPLFFPALSMSTNWIILFSLTVFNTNMFMTASVAQIYLIYFHRLIICIIKNLLNISNEVFQYVQKPKLNTFYKFVLLAAFYISIDSNFIFQVSQAKTLIPFSLKFHIQSIMKSYCTWLSKYMQNQATSHHLYWPTNGSNHILSWLLLAQSPN